MFWWSHWFTVVYSTYHRNLDSSSAYFGGPIGLLWSIVPTLGTLTVSSANFGGPIGLL